VTALGERGLAGPGGCRPNGWGFSCNPWCPPRVVRRADGATAAGAVAIRIQRRCTDRAGAAKPPASRRDGKGLSAATLGSVALSRPHGWSRRAFLGPKRSAAPTWRQ
jgi:hypothetical protein